MGKQPTKMRLNSEDIKKQSEAAYGQWCVQWREHAKEHAQYDMKSLEDFRFTGVGRPVLLVGNGYSLEENIETIKEFKDKVDIFCCDKSLGHLIDNGIKPTYCMVCDANVDYEKYCAPYEGQLDKTYLFMNVCGNPEWTKKGKWKDVYFFVNRDVLKSEKEFAGLSGCPNAIPAATNVSNAMIVMMTQSDEKGRINFFGYDKVLLIGYDYSWPINGNYYAFDKSGGGKHNYMRHAMGWDKDGNFCYTSNNLIFSAKWGNDYVSAFHLPVIQCGKEGVSGFRLHGDLRKHLEYEYKPENAPLMQALHKKLEIASRELNQIKNQYLSILNEHEDNMFRTV